MTTSPSPSPPTTPRPAPSASPAPDPGRTSFRPDVEGLRAVAVTLVVAYHAWPAAVPGGFVGVDAFFVISGYLITGHLLSNLRRRGSIGFADFYARRIRRILPAATLTLVVVLVAGFVVLPAFRAQSESIDSVWASVFALNIHLAVEGTNYLNASAPPSPIQNFWSLSVEEQFYAVWPLLLLAATVLARRTSRRRQARSMPTWALGAAVGVIFVASLAVDLSLTRSSPPWAYYSLFSRAWELAAGAGLALATPFLARAVRRAGPALAWAGLLALVGAALFLSNGTEYPGIAALWPVAAAAAIIAGGIPSAGAPGWGVGQVLGARPSQAVGRLSYSWYLWHFPALILVPYLFNRESLPIGVNIIVALASLGVAAVAFRLVEQPLRTAPALKRSLRATFSVGAGLIAVSVVAALAVSAVVSTPASTGTGRAAPPPPTSDAQIQAELARALHSHTVPAGLTPSLANATNDSPVIYRDGCHLGQLTVVGPPSSSCVFGDVSSPTTVVLFGDSHAAQWFPTLETVSLQEHWRLVSLTKSACAVADVSVFNPYFKAPYTECDTWRAATEREIARLHPRLVVVAERRDYGSTTFPDSSAAFLPAWRAGVTSMLRQLHSTGASTVLIDDTPHASSSIPDCLALHPGLTSACQPTASVDYDNGRRLADRAAAASQGATLLDPIPWFCTPRGCPAIVGRTLVYRDDQHMTTAYAEWLVPLFRGVVVTAMGR